MKLDAGKKVYLLFGEMDMGSSAFAADGAANGSTVPSDLIDLKAAAALCDGCHINTVRRWVLAGKIPGYRRGSRVMLVSRAELMACWIKRIEIAPAGLVPLTKAAIDADQAWVNQRLKALGVLPK